MLGAAFPAAKAFDVLTLLPLPLHIFLGLFVKAPWFVIDYCSLVDRLVLLNFVPLVNPNIVAQVVVNAPLVLLKLSPVPLHGSCLAHLIAVLVVLDVWTAPQIVH